MLRIFPFSQLVKISPGALNPEFYLGDTPGPGIRGLRLYPAAHAGPVARARRCRGVHKAAIAARFHRTRGLDGGKPGIHPDPSGACRKVRALQIAMPPTHQIFATTPRGMEPLLAAELPGLGAVSISSGRSGVFFEGGMEAAYMVCLWSRFASRVLMPLRRFSAATPEDLYAGVRDIDWSQHVSADGTLAVDCHSAESQIDHTHFASLKVKDAIVDQIREASGIRPSVELQRPDLRTCAKRQAGWQAWKVWQAWRAHRVEHHDDIARLTARAVGGEADDVREEYVRVLARLDNEVLGDALLQLGDNVLWQHAVE